MLQWARARGCPWDERTCEAAAASGHLGVLRWARAHGCPWREGVRSTIPWDAEVPCSAFAPNLGPAPLL